MAEPESGGRHRGWFASHRWRRRARRLGVLGLVTAAAAAGIVVFSGSGGGDDPLSEFCELARAERVGLAASELERSEALGRLSESAPEDLGAMVEAASAVGREPGVDDVFVVPGDPNSAVRVDEAAELFGRMAESGQAWDRVEQVLVGECELDLDEGASG